MIKYTLEYVDDGKDKWQSQEIDVKIEISDHNIYGSLTATIYGGDLDEGNENKDKMIDALIISLKEMKKRKNNK